MSEQHPIVAITGSTGAGTTTVRRVFNDIFRKQGVNAAFVKGDSFFRYEKDEMDKVIREASAKGRDISHFGPDANLFDKLESLFENYGKSGKGEFRYYIKDADDVERFQGKIGSFTKWEPLPKNSDLLFYEGMHGGVVASTWTRRRETMSRDKAIMERRNSTRGVDVAQYVDLLIGVVPIVNLEWIQKIHRDCAKTGCSAEESASTILRRMRDYTHFIVPQFGLTDINFQRIPMVDTSNPFIARDIPTEDESMVVIHFRDPKQFDFPALLQRINGAFMSRPSTMVAPGGKMKLAMEMICSPLIEAMIAKRKSTGTRKTKQ